MSFNKDIDKITEREVVNDFVERLYIGDNFKNPNYTGMHNDGEQEYIFEKNNKLKDDILSKIITSLPTYCINNLSSLISTYNKNWYKRARLFIPEFKRLYKVIHEETGFDVTNLFLLNDTAKNLYFDAEYNANDNNFVVNMDQDNTSKFIAGNYIYLRFKNGYTASDSIEEIEFNINNTILTCNLTCDVDNKIPTEYDYLPNDLMQFKVINNREFKYVKTRTKKFIPSNYDIKTEYITESDGADSSGIKLNIDNINKYNTIYYITLKTDKNPNPSIILNDNTRILCHDLNPSIYKASSVIKVLVDGNMHNTDLIVLNGYSIYEANFDATPVNNVNTFKAYYY